MREHKLKEQQLKEEREQAKKKEAELKICGAEKMQAELVSPSTFLTLFFNTFCVIDSEKISFCLTIS
jgi:hypothetical protein